MASDYAYDEDGYLWPFFVFTLAFIVTLPLTYLLVNRARDPAASFPRIKTTYRPSHADLVDAQRAKDKRKQQRNTGLTVGVVVGWAIMAYMLYLINTTAAPSQKVWNPYDILGISDSASEKLIKDTFRALSKRLHPDKVKPDASKNETLESLNDQYVEISKAYQALTDEDIRNNYIQYGHPDGKQTFSINIALPKIIISDGNGKYVILLYFLLFGVLLPYVVGSWWYGTQSRSKEGVLMESANRLFREYDDAMDESAVVAALSTGKEFEASPSLKGDKSDAGLSRIESKITAAAADASAAAAAAAGDTMSPPTTFASGMSAKDREKLQDLDSGVRRKVLALLWAYLGRVDLGDAALEKAKFDVGPAAHSLTRAFTAIALAYGNTGPILASYYASQLTIQAMPPKSSPLLQLPYVTPAVAKAIEGENSRGHVTVQKFMDQPDAKRRALTVAKKLLTEHQYATAVDVARQLPYFRVAKSFFKVSGEKYIIPSSLVSLVVKGRFIPPGSEAVPDIDELDLEDVDPPDDDVDAVLGRKSNNKRRPAKDADGKPLPDADADAAKDHDADAPVYPPLAYAPYFGRDYSPRWHVFLTDSKQGKMAVPPFTFTQFDRPIFQRDGKTPTFNMQTMRAQFQAPPGPGHYTFVMHVMCDSYVGFDTKMEVTMIVEEASKAESDAEDEISEPDEDSLAGILNAAKGGAPPPRKKRKDDDEDDEEDESGTEESADDASDTNTDTEPEN